MSRTQELKQYEKDLRSYEDQLKEAEERVLQKEQQINQQMSQVYDNSAKQNLVEWELDFKPELEDIRHSLMCDVITVDAEGNQSWGKNPDESKIILNELGVNDILRKIIVLVNKNKVLSHYGLDEIKDRVRMIGHEMRATIYTNYEAYGIDNEYKMNNYNSLVMDVLDIIESAFRRAIKGETHRGLSEQRLVTQNENVTQQPQMAQPQIKNKKWYNPSTW